MSVPARAVAAPVAAPVPRSPTPPARRPPAEPPRPAQPSRRAAARPRTRAAAGSRRRARRGVHAGFVVFAGLLVGTLLVGIVSLQAMLAQTSFHTVQLRSEIGALADRYDVLTSEAARLSAPDRIAAWARANGMQQADPAHTVIVPVKALDGAPGSGKGGPGQDAALVKPILGSAG